MYVYDRRKVVDSRTDVLLVLQLLDCQYVLQGQEWNVQACASNSQSRSIRRQVHWEDKGRFRGILCLAWKSKGYCVQTRKHCFNPWYSMTYVVQGFRMLVGDANNRVSKNLKSQTCFRCYTGPNFGGDNAAPCQDAK